MTTPLQNLPNEIMDIIFNQLTPSNVWSAQQSSKSIEHALDFHLLARRHAVDELMEWGCTQGSIEAINKAVSLGADPNLIEKPTKSGPFHSTSTIALASNHPYLVNHLFRLGANLRLAYVYEDVHQEIFLQQKPQLLKSCLNHCTKDQFTSLQFNLDKSLHQQVTNITGSMSSKRTAAMEKVKCWLELGANPMSFCLPPSTSLSTAILAFSTSRHWNQVSLQIISLVKLLLSAKPDLNALAVHMNHKSITQLKYDEGQACPIVAATINMARTGSTDIMELLLEAGAKIDLPIQVEFNPLVVYAKQSLDYNARGYDFLFSYGANVLPDWYNEHHNLTPILELWNVWGGRRCLLNDMNFNTIKLFIERHAVQNVATAFVEHWFRQPVSVDIDAKSKHLMMERSRMILKLILRDFNFKTTMAEEMKPLLQTIIQLEKTGSPDQSIIDPILKDMLMPHVKLTISEQ
ncbi:hypothetical protein FSHL1_011250 [Fusarium sambucinum]